MNQEQKEVQKKIEEKKRKIVLWLKNPYNLGFLAIILAAIIIRLYYFFLTKNQPLWWDEAEYMLKAKSIALGTPDTGWWYGRPILFPLISSIFFKLGLGEIGIRFIWLIMSVFNVCLIYFLGRELFNKRVGLIASALMSVSYIELFYSNRMLVNLPEVFFTLVAFILFVKVEFSNQNKKLIRWILPLLMIGT